MYPRSNSNQLACHDTVMFAQVRVDEISSEHSELYLGVTKISPALLVIKKFFADLEDYVIVGPSEVYFHRDYVSFRGSKSDKWLVI